MIFFGEVQCVWEMNKRSIHLLLCNIICVISYERVKGCLRVITKIANGTNLEFVTILEDVAN